MNSFEQERFRTRHPIKLVGRKTAVGAENFRIGAESDAGTAAVGRIADNFEFVQRTSLGIVLTIKLFVARHFNDQALRQSIDDRRTDTVQAAGNFIGVAAEFAAGMQHRHNHFKRRLVWIFRVRIDRNTATVVTDRDGIIGIQRQFNPVGITGHRLIHRIVQNLGHQMMQRLLIGTADIHTGTCPNRFQTFQNLNVLCRITGLCRCRTVK